MFVAGGLERRVEVSRVFLVEIGRCEVGTATEPPREDFRFVRGVSHLEVAVISVHCWCVWVARMDDEGETGGEEGGVWLVIWIIWQCFVVFAHLLHCRGGEGAMDNLDVGPRPFENCCGGVVWMV